MRLSHRIYNLSIFKISIIFSIIVGSGFWGYGIDYYEAYHFSNLNWGGWQDKLGFRLSTFTIFDIHVGVYLVSFILSISLGFYLRQFLILKKMDLFFFYILIYIIGIHTWPIIMSTSNAMRQGISMSLIFISFGYLLSSKNLKSFIFIFIAIFTHNSGIFYFLVFIYLFFLKFITKYLNFKKFPGIWYLLSGIIFFCLTVFSLKFTVDINGPSRIIEGDYRYPFLLISLAYISIFSYKFRFLKYNDVCLFLYLFCFVSSAVLFLELNWQYERLMMMMTLPLILTFSLLLKKEFSYFFIFLVFIALLILTILNGMYDQGLTLLDTSKYKNYILS